MQAKQDPCCQPGLMHPDQAISQLLDQVRTVQDTEVIQLSHSLGRVLAEDLAATLDLPPFNNSAMDGYAFRLADLTQHSALKLIGYSFAGHAFSGDYQPGSCVRIMTGAPVPDCYDTVQMQEKTQADGEMITIEPTHDTGENIRARGEEMRAGAPVLKTGTQIGAAEMGVLATIGVNQVRVYRQLTVAFFSTGDELRPVGSELAPGQIYDSNRYSILGMLQQAGVDWVDLGVIQDDPEAIRAAFQKAASQADLVLTSGGVSVGDADFTKQILSEEGEITFWRMAIKPGKPFAFGRLGKAVFCGLPGNPVSSMVTFYKIVTPLLNKMRGLPQRPPLRLSVPLAKAIYKHPGRVEYQRGILSRNEAGELEVTTTGSQGSGMLTSMSLANCFIILPQMQGDTPAGSLVDVEPFHGILS
ncbi:molybdopterin molybdenumtransferase MoeA [Shewanella sp. NFH-SH190041]|uniref:molybdopterin molybdotransferase MoeA n=1 Tax=Shewanella sp. NFH-SH190041 TaxID=2950245 RepID=UPI0021C30494|nr:molybdopterin molybdotransferase MoeA [Shewanella sp. NFH-SH190041]BDM62628.1 molybdopterin molybdenumtransferase MoeA [Shewanella sp. NFH-SH190041]